MLGCFAKAKSYEIMVDTTEVRSLNLGPFPCMLLVGEAVGLYHI